MDGNDNMLAVVAFCAMLFLAIVVYSSFCGVKCITEYLSKILKKVTA